MNNVSILNALHYKSKVEIIVHHDNGRDIKFSTHNEVLPAMSEFFAQSIIGYDTRSTIPTSVMLKQKTQDAQGAEREINILLSPSIITGKNYSKVTSGDYVGYYQLSFNILIASNALNSQANLDNTKNYLYLQNAVGSEFAKIALVNDAGEDVALSTLLGGGKNLIINWKIILCNYKGDNA